MKKTTNLFTVFFIVLVSTSHFFCNIQDKESSTENHGNGLIPYNLGKPDKKINLDFILREISALSYYKNMQLASLHDEHGDIFIIDYEQAQIADKIRLAGNGDFEGVEIINNVAYMLKSDGLIIKAANFNEEAQKVTLFKTGLSSKNDCEGLGYDKQSNSLLIACKNKPYLDKNNKLFKGKRAVYAYDLKKQELIKNPVYLIDLSEIEKLTGKKDFMPSGIAVHPITHNIYIIASVGKMLVVLNREGLIIDFARLDRKIFRQPEGICFSPDGKQLFISNEGKKNKGNILIFNVLKQYNKRN